ncbi:hypothetical protein NF701_02455 [Sphingomonadaceae bacterium OTU29THOMA1]|nr:hypothetical protein NF701_02455 [Sphingomonadaceae bacterium OTU29THOMA1]
MAVDTKSMRDLVDASPGDRMAMEKRHLQALIDAAPGDRMPVEKSQIRALLDAVELGRVAEQLAGMSRQVLALAIAA